MILLIDAGNTRIKWALVKGDEWLRSGVLHVDRADELPQLFSDALAVRQIWVSNVAGKKCAQPIRNIVTGGIAEPHFVVAQKTQCGVRNGYANPSQLGSDRWAALIAAWHLVRGGCLVVNSGTATTIDTLSAQGEFVGGLILPGIELMQNSLVVAANQLQSARGEYVPLPLGSADAIYSGAIQASCGAIERQYRLLGDDGASLILSGGAVEALQPHLDWQRRATPPRIVDNLVLQGLLLISREVNC